MLMKSFLLLLYAVFVSAASYNLTTYTYKTVGDLKIDLEVYTPPKAAPASGYPVLFTIHGGAYIQGSKSSGLTTQERTEALNRGWVIVSIDYRLIPGAFLQELVQDVQDAYTWVRTELAKKTPINPNLITVFGKSAGGGLAVVGGYKISPRPAVIVGFYPGLTNWTDPLVYNPKTTVDPRLVTAANQLSTPVLTEYTPASSSEPIVKLWHSAEGLRKAGWLAVTHDPDMPSEQVLAILTEYSATENVDSTYPPTYLAHGQVDTVVPFVQSVQLAGKLHENNIPFVIDLVPFAGHGFDSDSTFWDKHVLPAFDFIQDHIQQQNSVAETTMKFLEK